MKLGIFLMGSKDSSYFDIVDQVVEADALGFDGVWLAERYFASGDLLWPSPMLAAAYLAASTRRIRVGLAARVLPFHHPLHVAADACTLDVLSEGRLDLQGAVPVADQPVVEVHQNAEVVDRGDRRRIERFRLGDLTDDKHVGRSFRASAAARENRDGREKRARESAHHWIHCRSPSPSLLAVAADRTVAYRLRSSIYHDKQVPTRLIMINFDLAGMRACSAIYDMVRHIERLPPAKPDPSSA